MAAPLFDSVHLSLPGRAPFRIVAYNQHDRNLYSQCALLDGTLTGTTLFHDDLLKGKLLEFSMTDTPTEPCVQEVTEEPALEEWILPIPWFDAPAQLFSDYLEVRINPARIGLRVERLVEENGKMTWLNVKSPLIITETCSIDARAVDDFGNVSHIVSAHYFKKPNNWKVELKSKYNPQYSAGGPEGLIDGIRGTTNWRKGDWQGYQGQDFEVIIDLGEVKTVHDISVGFLQDVRSWIWMPTLAEFSFSTDGKQFSEPKTQAHKVLNNDYEVQRVELKIKVEPIKSRYVKVIARNFGTIPDWHPGRGHEAFIFVDEITVN
jgi:hypothetical protein